MGLLSAAWADAHGTVDFDMAGIFWTCALPVFALFVVGACVAMKEGKKNRQWNDVEYPPIRAEWERKWLCTRCGEEFVPGAH